MGKSSGVIIGQKSPYANQFVQSVQDPFKRSVEGILDPISKAREAGTLTAEDVTNAQTQFEDAVAALLDTQKTYEGLGKGQATVVKQSHQELDPYIQTVRDIFGDHMNASIKPVVDPAATALPPVPDKPPSLATIVSAEGSSPAIKAAGAAAQAKKRAVGGGRTSTILTGPMGLGLPAQLKAQKTLLGFASPLKSLLGR